MNKADFNKVVSLLERATQEAYETGFKDSSLGKPKQDKSQMVLSKKNKLGLLNYFENNVTMRTRR